MTYSPVIYVQEIRTTNKICLIKTGELDPAEPQEGLNRKEMNTNDPRSTIPAKKSCTYGTGFLFCQNAYGGEEGGEDEESQYLSDLEQFFLEWFGD